MALSGLKIGQCVTCSGGHKMIPYVWCALLFAGVSCGNLNLVERIIKTCLDEKSLVSCLSNKTGKIIDRVMDQDVRLFDGFVLKRNQDNPEHSRSYSLQDSIRNFIDTHTLSLDLTIEGTEARGDSGSGSSTGGSFGIGKVDKKDRKYLYYALTAIMGMLGLSVPILLKGMALLAGKALLASKAALIIVGTVALKKIFQSDKEPLSVHTHTVNVDDHDRVAVLDGGYHKSRPYQPYDY